MAVAVRRFSRFAIIGDLHLRPSIGGYGFHGELASCLRWVRSLRREVDAVICVGDLFDLDRSARPLDFEAELARIRDHWGDDLEALEDELDVCLVGNHELWLGESGRWVDAVDVVTPLGRWRVEHGHRFDAWMKQYRRFTQLVTWTSGRVETGGAAGVLAAMRSLEGLAVRGALSGGDVVSRAVGWLKAQGGLAGLAIGHTHSPLALRLSEGPLLVNAGDCMSAPWRAAIIDGIDGEALVLEGTEIDASPTVLARASWRRAD